jgi:hypothetical protein
MAEKELTGPLPSLATANALAGTLDVLADLGRIDPIDAAQSRLSSKGSLLRSIATL